MVAENMIVIKKKEKTKNPKMPKPKNPTRWISLYKYNFNQTNILWNIYNIIYCGRLWNIYSIILFV